MDVVVTGATGFIGRRLVAALRGRGHGVTALVRDPVRARSLLGERVACVAWDASAPRGGEWEGAIAQADAVYNLAGEPISQRWTPAAKARIVESRVHATRSVVDAMLRAERRPRVLLNSSGISHYGDTGDREVDERSPAGTDGFLVTVTRAWEDEAVRVAAGDSGVREVRLRTGVVLGDSGGALAQMLTPFKLFAGGPVGGGAQWLPWVHMEDALGIALHALEHDAVRGPVNVVAPHPVRMREFARELGRALHRPAWLPVPAFAVRAAMGEMAALVTDSVRAVPRVAAETGYVWKFPELFEALADVLQRAA